MTVVSALVEEPVPVAQQVSMWRAARLVLEAAARSASGVEEALAHVPAGRTGIDIAVGGAAVAADVAGHLVRGAGTAARWVVGTLPRPQLAGELLDPARVMSWLADRGRRERAEADADIDLIAELLVPAVTAALLDRIDLTAVVRDRVELDVLAAAIDPDAVAARIDLDAIIARIDLVALASDVVDGMDLPEVIRQSTGSMTSDAVHGVRMQSIEADRALAGLVSRVLRRRAGPGRLAEQPAP